MARLGTEKMAEMHTENFKVSFYNKKGASANIDLEAKAILFYKTPNEDFKGVRHINVLDFLQGKNL